MENEGEFLLVEVPWFLAKLLLRRKNDQDSHCAQEDSEEDWLDKFDRCDCEDFQNRSRPAPVRCAGLWSLDVRPWTLSWHARRVWSMRESSMCSLRTTYGTVFTWVHVKLNDLSSCGQHKSCELVKRSAVYNFFHAVGMTRDGYRLFSPPEDLAVVVRGVVGVSRCFFWSVRSSWSTLRELRRRATHLPAHNLRCAPPRDGGVAVLDSFPLQVGLLREMQREALLRGRLWARLF